MTWLNRLRSRKLLVTLNLTALALASIYSRTALAGIPKCYGVTDTTNQMFFMVPNTGAAALPTSTTITLDSVYNAAGSA